MQNINRLFSRDGIWLALHWICINTFIKRIIPDESFVKLQYRAHCGQSLNLKNPQSFSEKLNWLKIHDHNPIYTKIVDKITVKDYVRKIIGNDYIIPTLGVYSQFDEIDFDLLPNQFVLKTNHSGGSAGVVICKDKHFFNKNEARKILEKSLKLDMYYVSREWPYKNIKRRILAEKLISNDSTHNGNNRSSSQFMDLLDYKFFCFNGVPKFLYVSDYSHNMIQMNLDWSKADFERVGFSTFDTPPARPKNLDEMISIASKLSHGIPHVRVDLYNVEGRIYFGEMTLYTGGGNIMFNPNLYNLIIGSYLDISKLQS